MSQQSRQLPLPLLYQQTPPGRRLIKEMAPAERPARRLERAGSAALSNAELLAIVLDTADSLDVAHDILAQLQTVQRLLTSSVAELCLIEGVARRSAQRVIAAIELGKRAAYTTPDERRSITSPADAYQVLAPTMANLEQEQMALIILDTRNRILATPVIYQGSINTLTVRIADLFRAAIRLNAAAIIAAHNHPSGDPSPSPEDVRTTQSLVEAGKLLGIDLLDHLIIGRHSFVSLKDRGLGF